MTQEEGSSMFQLDMRSGKSVYEQVIDNIKELIMTDALPEGSKLPSVRELSRSLTINPNTVQKAFKELERAGYIYTVTGTGTFVSTKDDIRADDADVSSALSDVRDAFKNLTYLGVQPDKAREMAITEIDEIVKNIKERTK